jgi:hypothetical protein
MHAPTAHLPELALGKDTLQNSECSWSLRIPQNVVFCLDCWPNNSYDSQFFLAKALTGLESQIFILCTVCFSVTGLPSYRIADYILSLFFKMITIVKDVSHIIFLFYSLMSHWLHKDVLLQIWYSRLSTSISSSFSSVLYNLMHNPIMEEVPSPIQ